MKKLKKFIFPIILISILIVVIIVFINKKENIASKNRTTSNNVSTNINDDNSDRANFSGENAAIYLGTHSQYETFTVVLNKALPKEELTKDIISKISNLLGYKIEINNVTFDDKNIYIDFSNEYAPFNIENSFIESDEERKYSVYGNDSIVYTIFNSIYKSLISYFGNEYNIYFNTNSENINISFDNFTFSINASTPYMLEE